MEIFKIKYRLDLCKKVESGGYQHVRFVNVSGLKDVYYTKDKQFTFEPNNVCYTKGRTKTQFKDIDTGETIFTLTQEPTINPNEIQQRNKEKLAKKATETTGSDISTLTVIAVGIGALMAGLLIMVIAYPMIFPDMMKQTAETAILIQPSTGAYP